MPELDSIGQIEGYRYERHRPDETPLYSIVETDYPEFLAHLEAERSSPRASIWLRIAPTGIDPPPSAPRHYDGRRHCVLCSLRSSSA